MRTELSRINFLSGISVTAVQVVRKDKIAYAFGDLFHMQALSACFTKDLDGVRGLEEAQTRR